jgi:hypothetical protein
VALLSLYSSSHISKHRLQAAVLAYGPLLLLLLVQLPREQQEARHSCCQVQQMALCGCGPGMACSSTLLASACTCCR